MTSVAHRIPRLGRLELCHRRNPHCRWRLVGAIGNRLHLLHEAATVHWLVHNSLRLYKVRIPSPVAIYYVRLIVGIPNPQKIAAGQRSL